LEVEFPKTGLILQVTASIEGVNGCRVKTAALEKHTDSFQALELGEITAVTHNTTWKGETRRG
jgi:hypothetical protein